MMGRHLLAIAFTLALTAGVEAQRRSLSPGEQAPSLSVEEWVKGDGFNLEPGQVYIVEFWATWCGPCRQAIPHLSDLQQQYRSDDLQIVGISNEEVDTVRRFVQQNGDKIEYTIAVDNRDRTKRAWMEAADLGGIPAAFIVDRRGKVQYIGHPMADDFDDILEKVIAGRYDAKLQKAAKPLLEAAERARNLHNWQLALRHYDEVIELDSTVFADVALDRFEMLLVDMGEEEQAYEFAQQMLQMYRDDWRFLIDLAETLAAGANIPEEQRNLDLAMEAAEAANRAGGRRPATLAAKAMVHRHMGEYAEAVRLQRRAWMTADSENKAGYEAKLRSYQQARREQVARDDR